MKPIFRDLFPVKLFEVTASPSPNWLLTLQPLKKLQNTAKGWFPAVGRRGRRAASKAGAWGRSKMSGEETL